MITALLLSSLVGVGQAPPTMLPPVTLPSVARPAEVPAATPATSCNSCEKAEEPKPETKYALEKLLAGTAFGTLVSDRGIKIYGWTEMSYSPSSASRSNSPVAFNDRANGFQLNQNWLEIAKSVDASKNEVQFGFKTSLILPGTDFRYTLARGLWNSQRNNQGELRAYGFDIVNAYGEVFLPKVLGQSTTVRFGRWSSLIGYETNDAINSPFVSRAYTFVHNPFTHTGAMATTQLDDTWSMYHGIVTGSDVWIDPAGTATYVGGVKWAPKDGRQSVALNVVVNNHEYNRGQDFPNHNSYNLTFTDKLTDKFTYVFDTTVSHMDEVPNIGTAAWYGFANYFIYKANDKLTGNLRLEVFQDDKGIRTGTAGTYYEATCGVTYSPKQWLILRPFARFDHNRNQPFEGNKNLYTGGIDLIVRW